MSTTEPASRYSGRGVSATKSEVHAAVATVDKGLFPGAFCKIVADTLTGQADQCLVMHADGAGTKSALAYLYWRETGDVSVFKGIAQDAIVMNTDDLLCVGAVDNILISSTIGRNARRAPGEVIAALIEGTTETVDMLANLGVDIVSTGGETADVGDLVQTVIVDATAVARLPRRAVIDNANIRPGLAIVGLASFGRAFYEKEYNSGMGSNGLTSARHDVFHHAYADKYPETVDPLTPKDLVYAGKWRVTDTAPDLPITLGKAVLSPTRTYLPVARALLREHPGVIVGMVHCSGGGQVKCRHFGHGIHYVKDHLFDPPPLFRIIRECSGADWREMYQVFNMGHRLEVYVEPHDAQTVIDMAGRFGIEARVVGRCEAAAGETNTVAIATPDGVIHY